MRSKSKLRKFFKKDLPTIRKILLNDKKNEMAKAYALYTLAHTTLYDFTCDFLVKLEASLKAQQARYNFVTRGFPNFTREVFEYKNGEEDGEED